MTVAAPAPREAAPERTGAGYAGLATRAIALAADALVIDVVSLAVAGVVALALSLFHLPHSVRDVLVAVGAALAVVWSIAYFATFWSSTGQTPGNRLMRIRVLKADGLSPVSLRRALFRVAALVLSALLLCLGFLLVLVDRRRRALHDRLAGTVVVYDG